MNSKDQYDINEETLAALRVEEDAVRLISEKLAVKEMGPADHIRTKHEIKQFVIDGGEGAAKQLLGNAKSRRKEAVETNLRNDQTMGNQLRS